MPNNDHVIKVSVRRYTGEEEDGYAARTYLQACEDAMHLAGTTEPADKIAFVRDRVAPSSRAEYLLQSFLLSADVIGDDYDKFTQNFLRIFGGGGETTLITQINNVVEEVSSNLGSLDLWESTVPPNHQTEACVRMLKKEGWLENNGAYITTEKFTKFLQLLLCMLQAQEKVRLAALSLQFLPTDDIGEFFTQIERNLAENRWATAVSVASNPPSISPSYSYVSTLAKKQAMTCDYCHKVGHISKKCLKRKNDQRNSTSVKDDWAAKPAFGGVTPSVKANASPETSNAPEVSSKTNQTHSYYCAYHGHQGTHSTERCYSLQRMREDHERKRFSGGKSSGKPLVLWHKTQDK